MIAAIATVCRRGRSSHACSACSATARASFARPIPPRQPASRPARPLNVLLIIIDDVAANLHSVNGNGGPLRTPNIKRLANRGTWFTRAYADAPACCPSHTALVIGVHAARSGVYCAGFFPTEDAADVPDVNPEKDGSRWQDETFTAAK